MNKSMARGNKLCYQREIERRQKAHKLNVSISPPAVPLLFPQQDTRVSFQGTLCLKGGGGAEERRTVRHTLLRGTVEGGACVWICYVSVTLGIHLPVTCHCPSVLSPLLPDPLTQTNPTCSDPANDRHIGAAATQAGRAPEDEPQEAAAAGRALPAGE